MTCSMLRVVTVAGSLVIGLAGAAQAQVPDDRVVGRKGAVQLGFSGFLDKSFTTSDATQPFALTLAVDVGRFATEHLVFRFGVVGSGSFGGASDSEFGGGGGGAALFGYGGMLFYFTPDRITSGYVGADYSTQLTNRIQGDAGNLQGKIGVQTALSAHSSFFVEGGYGVNLSSPDYGFGTAERQQRISGQFGLRFLF